MTRCIILAFALALVGCTYETEERSTECLLDAAITGYVLMLIGIALLFALSGG